MPEANCASVQPMDRQGLETQVTELIAQRLRGLHGVKTVELEAVHVKEQSGGVITRSIGLASDGASVIMRFIGVTIVRVIRIVPSVGTSVTQLQNTIERTKFDPRELIRLIEAGSTSAQAPGAESKPLFAKGIRPIAVKIGGIRGVASVDPGEYGVSDTAHEPSEVKVQGNKILVKVWFGNNWQVLVVESEAFDGDLEPLAKKIRDALGSETRSDQARSVPRSDRPSSAPPRPPDSSDATGGADYEVYAGEDVKLDAPVMVSAQQADTYRFLQKRFPALLTGHIVVQGLFRLLETQFPGEGVNQLGGIKGTGLVRSLGRVSGSSQKRFLLVKAEIKTAESAGRIRHKPDERPRVKQASPRSDRPSSPPRPPSVSKPLKPDEASEEETAMEVPVAPVRAPAPSSPDSDQTDEDLMSLFHFTVNQRTELLAQGFDVDTNLSHECRDGGCPEFTITFRMKRRSKPGQ